MTTETAKGDTSIIEQVVLKGDLSQLTPQDRVRYYISVCESLHLNPLTQPFQYISLQGKLVFYATRAATDQLRRLHGVSTTIVSETKLEGIYIVKAKATDRDGRSEESTGAVTIEGLKGDALCNALMKAETKSKRRATLALVGLGWLDESEIETIPNVGIIDHERPALPTPDANGNQKPAAKMASPKLIERYSELWREAKGLGIDAVALRFPCAEDDAIVAGKALAEKIAAKAAKTVEQPQEEETY